MGKQEIVNIIAAGQSVASMDVNEICRRAYTIGVNGSAIYAPVHMGISMDRRWTEYYIDKIRDKPFWVRKCPEKWAELWLFKCNENTDIFSEVPGHLNGKSSGHCALNLAYHMRPKKIYLFGYDYSAKPYWYPPYPWVKYPTVSSRIVPEWLDSFDVHKKILDAAGIEVVIVGLESKLTQFKKISYEEYLKCA